MKSILETVPNVSIERQYKTASVAHSTLSINHRDICYTFENLKYLITPGTYIAGLVFSQKFQRLVYRLIVAGHEGIEIHPANFSRQLDGCFATVKECNEDGGFSSIHAFEDFMAACNKSQTICIEITENWQTS